MEVNLDRVQKRVEALFKKEERAREGAEAMLEYKADVCAVREKTARLRALRLAKEAGDNVAKLNKKPISSKTTQKTSRVRKKQIKPLLTARAPRFSTAYSSVSNIGDIWSVEEGADESSVVLDIDEVCLDAFLEQFVFGQGALGGAGALHVAPDQFVRV